MEGGAGAGPGGLDAERVLKRERRREAWGERWREGWGEEPKEGVREQDQRVAAHRCAVRG